MQLTSSQWASDVVSTSKIGRNEVVTGIDLISTSYRRHFSTRNRRGTLDLISTSFFDTKSTSYFRPNIDVLSISFFDAESTPHFRLNIVLAYFLYVDPSYVLVVLRRCIDDVIFRYIDSTLTVFSESTLFSAILLVFLTQYCII